MKPKSHPDYPDYLFYSDGSIRTMLKLYDDKDRTRRKNPKYGQFIKCHLRQTDHLLITCVKHRDGSTRSIYPHKITAKLFVPNPENKKHVGFKDGNKKNIDHTNLYWKNRGGTAKTVDEIIKQMEKDFK